MQGSAFVGWQQVLGGGCGKRSWGRTGWVWRRVLTTSNGVTNKMLRAEFKATKESLLVRAVRVEPDAAATSFAWKGSMELRYGGGGRERDGRAVAVVRSEYVVGFLVVVVQCRGGLVIPSYLILRSLNMAVTRDDLLAEKPLMG